MEFLRTVTGLFSHYYESVEVLINRFDDRTTTWELIDAIPLPALPKVGQLAVDPNGRIYISTGGIFRFVSPML
jgi:hypothetical protein